MSVLMPFALAGSLQVEKIDKGSVVISELSNPAVFEFTINNPDSEQQVELYSFVGINFNPRGLFDLPPGKSTIEVKAYPSSEIRKKQGLYNFEYELKGSISGITKDSLSIKIVGLKDAMELKAEDIYVKDDKVTIKIINTQNADLEDIKLHFSSLFFDEEKTFSLKPYESKEISIAIDKEKIKKLASGSYIYDAEVELESAKIKIDGTLNYLPKEESNIVKSYEGLILRKTTYTFKNTGNVPINGKITINKDILSRLFTVNSAEPLEIKRNALFVKYDWEQNLQPDESFSVTSTTNYTLPFILVLLVVIIALLVRLYTRTHIQMNKKVSFVKTKGGEFALKVTLHVKAKKYVENLQVIDRLPGMTQLYEKFGVKPDKIDASTRRLFWNIDRLNAGEERVYSYIVYSKVRVVGRFELPSATATYLRDGKTEQVFSNRTFFVSETVRTDI